MIVTYSIIISLCDPILCDLLPCSSRGALILINRRHSPQRRGQVESAWRRGQPPLSALFARTVHE